MIASEANCHIEGNGSFLNKNNHISDNEGSETEDIGYYDSDDSIGGESDTDFVDFVNIVDDAGSLITTLWFPKKKNFTKKSKCEIINLHIKMLQNQKIINCCLTNY